MSKKVFLKYLFMYSLFILGVILYSSGIITLFSSILLFGGGYISLKNTFDYRLIKRNFNKPMCILVSNTDMAKKLVKNICPLEQKLMDLFWPGDLTIVFNKSKIVPDLLTSNLDTIGIRIPNNKICLDLINTFGNPLATSSANIAEKTPALAIDNELIADFNNKVNFIIDSGIIPQGVPSTIVRVENDEVKILREGSISLDKINELILQERIDC